MRWARRKSLVDDELASDQKALALAGRQGVGDTGVGRMICDSCHRPITTTDGLLEFHVVGAQLENSTMVRHEKVYHMSCVPPRLPEFPWSKYDRKE